MTVIKRPELHFSNEAAVEQLKSFVRDIAAYWREFSTYYTPDAEGLTPESRAAIKGLITGREACAYDLLKLFGIEKGEPR